MEGTEVNIEEGPTVRTMESKVSQSKSSKEVVAEHLTGKVKWFNVMNGYGFIIRNDNQENVFVYKTSITKNNPNNYVHSLGDDEEVEFDVVKGEKGLEAANVTGPNGSEVVGSKYAIGWRPRFFFYMRRNGGRPPRKPRETLDGDEEQSRRRRRRRFPKRHKPLEPSNEAVGPHNGVDGSRAAAGVETNSGDAPTTESTRARGGYRRKNFRYRNRRPNDEPPAEGEESGQPVNDGDEPVDGEKAPRRGGYRRGNWTRSRRKPQDRPTEGVITENGEALSDRDLTEKPENRPPRGRGGPRRRYRRPPPHQPGEIRPGEGGDADPAEPDSEKASMPRRGGYRGVSRWRGKRGVPRHRAPDSAGEEGSQDAPPPAEVASASPGLAPVPVSPPASAPAPTPSPLAVDT